MNKKSTKPTLKDSESEDKSVFRQAGDLIGNIGAHIVEAKDSVLGFVSDEVKVVKKAVKKVAKKITKKSPAKKTTPKKTIKKTVKKTVKKISPKKAVKRVTKKVAKKRKLH